MEVQCSRVVVNNRILGIPISGESDIEKEKKRKRAELKKES
jgi:hypothetical protein